MHYGLPYLLRIIALLCCNSLKKKVGFFLFYFVFFKCEHYMKGKINTYILALSSNNALGSKMPI